MVERLRTRREICVWTAGTGRCFLLGAAAAPLLAAPTSIMVLIGSLAIYQGMAAIGGCAWNSWMRDLVPPAQYGRFFGQRTAATTAVAIIMALLGGLIIDVWKTHIPGQAAFGYSFLFTLGALFGFLGVYLLRRTRTVQWRCGKSRASGRAALRSVEGHQFPAPHHLFFVMEFRGGSRGTLLRRLHVEDARPFHDHDPGLTIVSQLSNMAGPPLWGALIDRFSNKAVLGIAAPLFLACTLGWTFTGLPWLQPFVLYVLVAVHVLMGVSTAGSGLPLAMLP